MKAMSAPAAVSKNQILLQDGVASLADRISSLPRRFAASLASLAVAAVQLAENLTTAETDAAFDCRLLACHAAKTLESAAEEVRVAAAQLEAYALLLEREVEDGEERAEVAVMACSLLATPTVAAPGVVVIKWDSVLLSQALEAAVCVRDYIYPLRCTVSGDGMTTYQAGGCDNYVSVVAVDGEGGAVESIEAGDVRMGFSVEGASVASVCVGAAGTVEVVYRLPGACVDPVVLGVSVCGSALHGSAWTVEFPLGGSTILANVDSSRRTAFLRKLAAEWLPFRGFTLLYRGSRDGITSQAFHSLCDDKGPTLVLIRCDKGFVFGGYAGASWESPKLPNYSKLVRSPDSFLFSVVGPHSPDPVMFPVGKSRQVLYCSEVYGPVFDCGVMAVGILDNRGCIITKQGAQTLPASTSANYKFTAVDIEVFAVTRV